jgi:ribosomal protein S18 acetylase RimI-like enzyme
LREFRAEDGRRISIRPARPSDLTRLLKFANILVKEKRRNRELGVAAFDKRITLEFERKFLRGMVEGARKKEAVALLAWDRGELVGLCSTRRREPSDLHHTGVLGIVIRDGYRGVGVGETLISEVLKECRRMGIWLVELEVLAINARAKRLYEKVGFKQVGVVPNKVLRDGKHIDIIAMYADLRGTDKSGQPGRRKS